jgi:NAD(P)-dependent dehydrogenase (short-subunit alcohol dehydrogenase family)
VEISGKVALVTGSSHGIGREMGGIDVLINNAAIFEYHPVLEVYQS